MVRRPFFAPRFFMTEEEFTTASLITFSMFFSFIRPDKNELMNASPAPVHSSEFIFGGLNQYM